MENKYVTDVLIQAAQQSVAWDKLRLGKFTGSGISALMTEPRSKADKDSGLFSQTALKYIHEKLMEQVTGQVCYESSGRAIDWGNEWEETALKELAKHLNCPPEKMILKPSFKLFNEYSGCSPDAFMEYEDSTIGVEIKCPFNSLNHFYHSQVVDAVSLKEINSDYYWQVQMNMLTFGKTSWMFASFDPRQPDNRIIHYSIIEFVPSDCELLCEKMERAFNYKQELYLNWTK